MVTAPGSGSELSQWKQIAAPIHQRPSLLATQAACADGPRQGQGVEEPFSCHLLRDRREWGRGMVRLRLKVKARELWVRRTLLSLLEALLDTPVGASCLPYFRACSTNKEVT